MPRKVRHILRRWLPVAVTIIILCGLVYLAVQQALRQGANDPQIQMAEDTANAISLGSPVESVLPAGQVEMSESLAPFVIIYDETGEPLASSGLLFGEIPRVPSGVFDYVREHGEDRVTWQPEPAVRIAAVVVESKGSRPGFVLAGRSLREVEKRETQVEMETEAAGFAALLGSLVMVIVAELFMYGGHEEK